MMIASDQNQSHCVIKSFDGQYLTKENPKKKSIDNLQNRSLPFDKDNQSISVKNIDELTHCKIDCQELCENDFETHCECHILDRCSMPNNEQEDQRNFAENSLPKKFHIRSISVGIILNFFEEYCNLKILGKMPGSLV